MVCEKIENSLPELAAIIVTHNSGPVIEECLRSLIGQSGCVLQTIVVDSGSADTAYLVDLQKQYPFKLVETTNIGFAAANNLGCGQVKDSVEYLVFINPDTFLPAGYLQKAVETAEKNPEAAIVSGILVRYDLQKGKPADLLDSTGVFRRWYGRWYDRDQGYPEAAVNRPEEYVPAVCGALMVCRRKALKDYPHVFDDDFFLYKEDIELSIRLRGQGWKLLFTPRLRAYHCRGWQPRRRTIPRILRRQASESEVLLYRKHPSPYIVWALVKHFLVRYLGV